MSRIRASRAAAFALAAAAMSTAGVATAGAAGAAPQDERAAATPRSSMGCPNGAVCIYPNGSWNGGQPEHIYYAYGVHKLYNEYGVHRIYNNQYGGAWANHCTGSNGTGCSSDPIDPRHYRDKDLTPINSIKLYP